MFTLECGWERACTGQRLVSPAISLVFAYIHPVNVKPSVQSTLAGGAALNHLLIWAREGGCLHKNSTVWVLIHLPKNLKQITVRWRRESTGPRLVARSPTTSGAAAPSKAHTLLPSPPRPGQVCQPVAKASRPLLEHGCTVWLWSSLIIGFPSAPAAGQMLSSMRNDLTGQSLTKGCLVLAFLFGSLPPGMSWWQWESLKPPWLSFSLHQGSLRGEEFR